MDRPTLDGLKLARDGHLWAARYADNRWVRPLWRRMTVYANGRSLCEFDTFGALEYGGRTTEELAGPPLVIEIPAEARRAGTGGVE